MWGEAQEVNKTFLIVGCVAGFAILIICVLGFPILSAFVSQATHSVGIN